MGMGDRLSAMESRVEMVLEEGIKVMAAWVGQFKQDMLERLFGMVRTVVILHSPGRGGRLPAYEQRVMRGV